MLSGILDFVDENCGLLLFAGVFLLLLCLSFSGGKDSSPSAAYWKGRYEQAQLDLNENRDTCVALSKMALNQGSMMPDPLKKRKP